MLGSNADLLQSTEDVWNCALVQFIEKLDRDRPPRAHGGRLRGTPGHATIGASARAEERSSPGRPNDDALGYVAMLDPEGNEIYVAERGAAGSRPMPERVGGW